MSFARKGGTLTMAQLLKVLYNMKTAERVKAFLKGDVPDLPVICSAIAELIAVHRDLCGLKSTDVFFLKMRWQTMPARSFGAFRRAIIQAE